MQIIDGKKISRGIMEEIKNDVSRLPFVPIFCDVLVGDDPASVQYVGMKARMAERVGMKFHDAKFKASITTEALIEEIKKINKVENMCGVIVQLPLPEHIDAKAVLDAIDPTLDVDCLGEANSQNFYMGDLTICPPTALAVIEALDSCMVDLKGKNFAVLGYGNLVGKPVEMLLKKKGYAPNVIDRSTENSEALIAGADVLITGIGQGSYLKGEMVKSGVIIIDAGTSESGAGIVGDVDFESVKDKASYISPVPGGVGPLTVAMLFKNVLKVAQQKI